MIVSCTCALLTSCSPLAPQPDHSKFFILTPLADGPAPTSTPAAATPSSSLTIGIGPIDFPDYLRRLEVVTRASRISWISRPRSDGANRSTKILPASFPKTSHAC